MLEIKLIDLKKITIGVITGVIIGVILSLLFYYKQIDSVYFIKPIGGGDILAETQSNYIGVIAKLKN